jgi:hypothetical protein
MRNRWTASRPAGTRTPTGVGLASAQPHRQACQPYGWHSSPCGRGANPPQGRAHQRWRQVQDSERGDAREVFMDEIVKAYEARRRERGARVEQPRLARRVRALETSS